MASANLLPIISSKNANVHVKLNTGSRVSDTSRLSVDASGVSCSTYGSIAVFIFNIKSKRVL